MSKYLTDYSKDGGKWDLRRSFAEDIATFYASCIEFEKQAQRMGNCSGYLRFAHKINKETGELELKLRKASFCRVRHCPVCQERRTKMWQAKFFKALPVIEAEHPNARWLFLTLSVANPPIEELGDTLYKMNIALKQLTKCKEFRNGIIGWIRTTEVTKEKNRPNYAHPHFHVLLMVKPSYFKKHYISHARWIELWKRSLGVTYEPSVHIQSANTDIRKGALEVLKYSVKPTDMIQDRDWLIEMTRQLSKRRFIGTGGVLKDIFQEKEQRNEELIFTEDNPKPKEEEQERLLGFNWNKPERKYKRSKKG